MDGRPTADHQVFKGSRNGVRPPGFQPQALGTDGVAPLPVFVEEGQFVGRRSVVEGHRSSFEDTPVVTVFVPWTKGGSGCAYIDEEQAVLRRKEGEDGQLPLEVDVWTIDLLLKKVGASAE